MTPARLPRALAFAAWVLAAAAASAQTASLVADINPNASVSRTTLAGLAAFDGKLFFLNDSLGAGREVWVTDGTAAGTTLLADACPGDCSNSIEFLGGAGRIFYWIASQEGGLSRQLWRSDGTRAGTRPLAGPQGDLSIDVAGFSSNATGATWAFLGDRLIFAGCRPAQGCEPWATDGTDAGTVALPAPSAGPGDATDQLTVLKGRVYYFLVRNAQPFSLWASDGTAADTVEVASLPNHGTERAPRYLTALADRFAFVADGGLEELWGSDGTPAGTRRLAGFADVDPVPGTGIVALGGRAYLAADDGVHGEEIWTSDGTAAGTRRITDLALPVPFAFDRPLQMGLAGSRLVFVAADGPGAFRLWKTDGTPGSTAPISTVVPINTSAFFPIGGRLVFPGFLPGRLAELWTTDGTAAGTAPLAGICRGSCQSIVLAPATVSGRLLFAVGDALGSDLWTTDGTTAGTHRFTYTGQVEAASSFDLGISGGTVYFENNAPDGLQLWRSDGSPAGTRQVAELGEHEASSYPWRLTALGDGTVFFACDGSRERLWRSSGTAATTSPVGDLVLSETCDAPPFLPPSGPLPSLGANAFFTLGRQLWKSDGTPIGTVALTHLDESMRLGRVYAQLGNRLFFVVADQLLFTESAELWSSDGTPEGTQKVFDMPAGVGVDTALTSAGGALYFDGFDRASHLQSFWRSDGTAATPVDFLDFPTNDRFFNTFVSTGGRVFVLATGDGFEGSFLWTTDGTRGGTTLVRSFDYAGVFGPVELGALDGSIVFLATAGGMSGLWRSDGSAAGTLFLGPFRADYDSTAGVVPVEFTRLGNRLFFVGDDGAHGRQLWQTDGTAAGTALVRLLVPNSVSGLAAAGDRLYFTADDGVHGFELWTSDGTAAGTRLVQDIAPEAGSSSPAGLTVSGGRLYFAADDGLHGDELWSLPLDTPAGCQPAADHLCLAGGRFKVEATWRDFQGNSGIGMAAALTTDTGYFWFFNAANVEVVVKVLDGRSLNQSFWVFYGALSSVEYTLTVTDTQTGLTRRYDNPSSQLASVADTNGFGPLGAFLTAGPAAAPASRPAPAAASARSVPAAAPDVCTPAADRLCLAGGRFSVTATWKDFQGHAGTAAAVGLTDDTGYFWFFASDNVEVVAKVLDGRVVNGKFWLFYGALSSVEYTLTVTDTTTGAMKTYKNASGSLASVADTSAF